MGWKIRWMTCKVIVNNLDRFRLSCVVCTVQKSIFVNFFFSWKFICAMFHWIVTVKSLFSFGKMVENEFSLSFTLMRPKNKGMNSDRLIKIKFCVLCTSWHIIFTHRFLKESSFLCFFFACYTCTILYHAPANDVIYIPLLSLFCSIFNE